MGIADTFGREDRVEVTITQFTGLVREAVKAELLMNAIRCDVPHRFIREMATGRSEDYTECVKEEDE